VGTVLISNAQHLDDLKALDAYQEAQTFSEAEALRALGTIEPPDTFVGQVMWRTASRSSGNIDQRPSGPAGVRMTTAKKALIGLVGIAASGLVAVYVTGAGPVSQTEGTIGAAQRYQTGQISATDVKVGDPALQAFLQTDTFDKLIHDKQAVAALANPSVQAALMAPGVAQALAAPSFAQALASSQFQQAVATQGLQVALAAPSFQQALSAPAFQQAIASPAFQQALVNPSFQAAIASPAFQQALSSAAFQQGLSAPFLQGLTQQAQALSGSNLDVH